MINSVGKKKKHYMCLKETHFEWKDSKSLKAKGWKKIYNASTNQRKVGGSILFSSRLYINKKILSQRIKWSNCNNA